MTSLLSPDKSSTVVHHNGNLIHRENKPNSVFFIHDKKQEWIILLCTSVFYLKSAILGG